MEVGKNSVVYYTEEGYIVTVTGGWYDDNLGSKYNFIIVPKANSSTNYVLNGELVDKEDWNPIVEENTILNIPETSRVYVGGEKLYITDGILELDKPLSYKVKVVIDSATHLTKEVII